MPIPQTIQREHITKALDAIEKAGTLPPHRESTGYDVLYRGKRYPPKYVVALAHSFVNPVSGLLRGFRGGEQTNEFLEHKGFKIAKKRARSGASPDGSDKSVKASDRSSPLPVDGRQFWVVSPNVMNSSKTVEDWKQASVKQSAAFMGYGPDERKHKGIGYKFAHTVSQGDVILIARRHRNQAEVVGFGIVKGAFQKTVRGFTAPEKDKWQGSLRKLSPFASMSTPPAQIPIMSALFHTIALRQLRPHANRDHKTICNWMLNELVYATGNRRSKSRVPDAVTSLGPLSSSNKLEFEVRTREMVRKAKKVEEELVGQYHKWLLGKNRQLNVACYRGLRCDAYEEARRNLVEAKSSTKREYIRMAVGQLLDYSYLGRADLGSPKMAILLPRKPDTSLFGWLSELNISIIWKQRNEFFDNADGQFT